MKCPGQDTQYWNAQSIFEAPCPQCAAKVEFFKDDTTRKCPSCGHRFVNPRMDFGCAAYCAFAEQCLGDLPPELVAQKEDLLKDRVAVAVKRRLKTDFRSIGRASRRAGYAAEIGSLEGAGQAVALMAAYLWDFSDRSGGNGAGEASEARAILAELKAPAALVEKVCAIVSHRQAPAADRLEWQVAADAAAIALMEEEFKSRPVGADEIESRIQADLTTAGAQRVARKLFFR